MFECDVRLSISYLDQIILPYFRDLHPTSSVEFITILISTIQNYNYLFTGYDKCEVFTLLEVAISPVWLCLSIFYIITVWVISQISLTAS